jgi:ribosome-binding factor A
VQSRRTPVLQFAPDETIRAAARIDELLRRDAERHRTGTNE